MTRRDPLIFSQGFAAWFTDYPSTHRLAGQSVEVVPRALVAELEAELARLREAAQRERRDRAFWAVSASRERQRLERERDEARAELARLREAAGA